MYVTLRDMCTVASEGGAMGGPIDALRAIRARTELSRGDGYVSSMALATPTMVTPNDDAMRSALARASATAFCRASLRNACSVSS